MKVTKTHATDIPYVRLQSMSSASVPDRQVLQAWLDGWPVAHVVQ